MTIGDALVAPDADIVLEEIFQTPLAALFPNTPEIKTISFIGGWGSFISLMRFVLSANLVLSTPPIPLR